MISCIKRQTEIRKGVEQHRCLHSQAEQYKQLVNADICESCPLRIAIKVKPSQLHQIEDIPAAKSGMKLYYEYGTVTEKPLDYEPIAGEDGWGDWVQKRLAAVGVTKERYKTVKESVGLPPTCNCDLRQEWLNQIGHKFDNVTKTLFSKIWS